MLRLYSLPGTCAFAVHVALEWAGLPYELRTLSAGENHQLDYLQVNPMGSVPALRLDDGTVVTEASALLTYVHWLCPERFPAPSRSPLGTARLAESLSFYTTEMHAAFALHFAPARFHPDCDEHSALKAMAYERLRRLFDLTDDAFVGPFVFGPNRSVVDPYLFVLVRWLAETPIEIGEFPLINDFRQRMEMDDGVRRALGAYGS